MRFEFIRSANHGLSVKRACRALNVSRGGYYEHIKRGKSKAQIAREALVPFIEDAFYASNRRYGARRVAIELQKMGIMANRKTVQRIMSSRGARCSSGKQEVPARRQSVRCRDECPEQGFHHQAQECRVVWGHHVSADEGGLAVSGNLPRPVLQEDRRMAGVQQDR